MWAPALPPGSKLRGASLRFSARIPLAASLASSLLVRFSLAFHLSLPKTSFCSCVALHVVKSTESHKSKVGRTLQVARYWSVSQTDSFLNQTKLPNKHKGPKTPTHFARRLWTSSSCLSGSNCGSLPKSSTSMIGRMAHPNFSNTLFGKNGEPS